MLDECAPTLIYQSILRRRMSAACGGPGPRDSIEIGRFFQPAGQSRVLASEPRMSMGADKCLRVRDTSVCDGPLKSSAALMIWPPTGTRCTPDSITERYCSARPAGPKTTDGGWRLTLVWSMVCSGRDAGKNAGLRWQQRDFPQSLPQQSLPGGPVAATSGRMPPGGAAARFGSQRGERGEAETEREADTARENGKKAATLSRPAMDWSLDYGKPPKGEDQNTETRKCPLRTPPAFRPVLGTRMGSCVLANGTRQVMHDGV